MSAFMSALLSAILVLNPFAATMAAVDGDHPTISSRSSDDDRQAAYDRSSRQSVRGGVPPWRDSGYRPVWRGASAAERNIWMCIRKHESINAGHYRAQNPVSSASGAGQWIDSTWRGVARWVKVDGEFVARKYSRAKYAPAWVQDAAFRHVYKHGGLSMWHGTNCPGT